MGKPIRGINVTITAKELLRLAACSQRMTGYADSEEGLLITVLNSQEGIPVKLVLDKHCCKKKRCNRILLNSS
jgi:hypothetical protein